MTKKQGDLLTVVREFIDMIMKKCIELGKGGLAKQCLEHKEEFIQFLLKLNYTKDDMNGHVYFCISLDENPKHEPFQM